MKNCVFFYIHVSNTFWQKPTGAAGAHPMARFASTPNSICPTHLPDALLGAPVEMLFWNIFIPYVFTMLCDFILELRPQLKKQPKRTNLDYYSGLNCGTILLSQNRFSSHLYPGPALGYGGRGDGPGPRPGGGPWCRIHISIAQQKIGMKKIIHEKRNEMGRPCW